MQSKTIKKESLKTTERNFRKTKIVEVIRIKMDKTAVACDQRRVKHPVYKKMIKRSKNYFVHDPENKCKVGDVIRIMETRPLSKLKCWRLIDDKAKNESKSIDKEHEV